MQMISAGVLKVGGRTCWPWQVFAASRVAPLDWMPFFMGRLAPPQMLAPAGGMFAGWGRLWMTGVSDLVCTQKGSLHVDVALL